MNKKSADVLAAVLTAVAWFWTAYECDTIGIDVFDMILMKERTGGLFVWVLAAVLTVLMINEKQIKIDGLGREYDYSPKPYKVLCRSGWVKPKYIYRHKTDKPIYTVKDDDMLVEVTEDHSLFNDKQEKIKPSEVTEDTKLEYYDGDIFTDFNTLSDDDKVDDNWLWLLNANIKIKKRFLMSVQFDEYKNMED